MLSIMNEIDPYFLLPLCVLYEIQNQIDQHKGTVQSLKTRAFEGQFGNCQLTPTDTPKFPRTFGKWT